MVSRFSSCTYSNRARSVHNATQHTLTLNSVPFPKKKHDPPDPDYICKCPPHSGMERAQRGKVERCSEKKSCRTSFLLYISFVKCTNVNTS